MIKHLIIVIAVFIGLVQELTAQDPGFSQNYANLLYLNPAFAGSVKCPRLSFSYRNQWPSLGSTYVTYSASYDQYVDPIKGGLGLLVVNDVQGDGVLTNTNISGIYSYNLNINRNFSIRGGFQASYFQKKLDWNFVFPDMIDPLYGPILPITELQPDGLSQNFFDFSTGFLGFTEDYYFGIAIHHLTQPEESYGDDANAVLPRKFTVHFGANIPVQNKRLKKGDLTISPNFMFQQQMDFQQLNYGINFNRRSLVGGFSFRQNLGFHYDSFILLIGYVQSKFKFAYTYDLTISKLKNQVLGAHEISFSFQFNCLEKKKKFNAISNPHF